MGCSPWGHRESNTERLHFHFLACTRAPVSRVTVFRECSVVLLFWLLPFDLGGNQPQVQSDLSKV